MTSLKVIRLVVLMCVRFPLSLRNVEDLPYRRRIEISHETVRFCWNGFKPMLVARIRWKRVSETTII
jgi:putative transposase